MSPVVLWRCFPWDPAAPPGSPHSASYIAGGQGAGRFDLLDDPPVLYLGDTPAHVISEALQGYRNTEFHPAMLKRLRHPLAVVDVALSDQVAARLADLCDPAVLVRQGVPPDRTAHHERAVTQSIARAVFEAGFCGLRWWSVTTGAWHTHVLFASRIEPPDLRFGAPRPLAPGDDAVLEARRMLGIH